MKETQLLIETIENNNLWEKEIEISRNEYLKVKGRFFLLSDMGDGLRGILQKKW